VVQYRSKPCNDRHFKHCLGCFHPDYCIWNGRLYCGSPAGPDTSAAPASDTVRAEVSTIFLHSLAQGEISAADSQYLASVISRSTGISQNEANTRITQVLQQAQQFDIEVREAADAARRATAYSALWMFIALLCGAFVASLMATFGGRQRDAIS
jgi:hypothetical protein